MKYNNGYRNNPQLRHIRDNYFLMEDILTPAHSFLAPSWVIYKADGLNLEAIWNESAMGMSMTQAEMKIWALAVIDKLEKEECLSHAQTPGEIEECTN